MKALFLSILLFVPCLGVMAKDLVSAQFLADANGIAAGKPFTVGVKLKIVPDWHVYWTNPGDTGIPTKITFTLPEGFTAGPVQFPTPHRFDLPGGIVAFGYDNEVMFLATITPPSDLRSQSDVTLSAKAGWLVCDQDQCVKGDAKMELKLPVSAQRQPTHRDEFEKWRGQIPQMAANAQTDARIDAPDGRFKSATGTLAMEWKATAPEKVEWFPGPSDQLQISTSDIKTKNNRTTITFKVDALPGEKITDASFSSVVAYTIDGKRVGALVPVRLVVPGSKGS